jgi:Glycosyl transferase family 64 domain.
MRKRINSGHSSPSVDDDAAAVGENYVAHRHQHYNLEEEQQEEEQQQQQQQRYHLSLTPHRLSHQRPSDDDLEAHPSSSFSHDTAFEKYKYNHPHNHHHQQHDARHVRFLSDAARLVLDFVSRIWTFCSRRSPYYVLMTTKNTTGSSPRIFENDGSGTTSIATTADSTVIASTRTYKQRQRPFACVILLLLSLLLFSLTILFGNLTRKIGIVVVHHHHDDKQHRRRQQGRTVDKIILSPRDLSLPQYRSVTQPYKSQSTSFAVVINTFRRPDMLQSSLDHWVNTCGRNDPRSKIAKVYVVWAEVDKVPPRPEDIVPHYGEQSSRSAPRVQFIRVPKDSLNSRFLPIEELGMMDHSNGNASDNTAVSPSPIEAVFMVDDDVRVDCSSMWEGFQAWTYHPSALVGFYPRLASPKLNPNWFFQQSKTERVYHTWPVVYSRRRFNIILTKASFFHKRYLELYHNEEENPREVLEYVDQHKNCEDIAMAFLVARYAKQRYVGKEEQVDGKQEQEQEESYSYCVDCPVYVHGKIQDEGLFNGISTSGGSLAPSGHMEKRSMCLDALTEIYKQKRGWEYPLWDVSLSDQSWSHTAWGWWNAPSNIYEWFSFGNTLL